MTRTLDRHFAGGRWHAVRKTFDDLNPSDGSVWARVADTGPDEVHAAIDAAHAAFPAWAALPFHERSRFLLRLADEAERRAPELCAALQAEGGGWFGKGMFESGYVPEVFRAAAAAGYAPIGEVLPSTHGKTSLAVRRPIGVVSVISPWNFPALLTSRGFAFALAAGNTIVLKPSEETPYTGGLFFAELAEAVELPPGVFNVVTCSRDAIDRVGELLIEHRHVNGISFTGSTPVGRSVAARAGAHLKKACVELGGKDALIVLEDADLDRAATAACFGGFMHQGQICMSVEKVLAQQSVFDAFLERFVARAQALKVGDPTEDRSNVIGPLINDRQAAHVAAQIEDAVAHGARVECGGEVQGRFVEPTVLTGVTPEMRIWAEETFGPVVPVIPFGDDAEATAIANDTEYGLSSGVFTRDEQRGLAIADALDTGMCHVNCSSLNDEPHVPFGGSKSSGLGRHGGRWSTETFTETRWITLERGGRHFPAVFEGPRP